MEPYFCKSFTVGQGVHVMIVCPWMRLWLASVVYPLQRVNTNLSWFSVGPHWLLVTKVVVTHNSLKSSDKHVLSLLLLQPAVFSCESAVTHPCVTLPCVAGLWGFNCLMSQTTGSDAKTFSLLPFLSSTFFPFSLLAVSFLPHNPLALSGHAWRSTKPPWGWDLSFSFPTGAGFDYRSF